MIARPVLRRALRGAIATDGAATCLSKSPSPRRFPTHALGNGEAPAPAPLPSDDPIDRFLARLQTYVRNPGMAVTDFARFVVDSCRLIEHVSKPSANEVFKTSTIVLMVVCLFVGMLHASDPALHVLRELGRSAVAVLAPRAG